MDTRVLKEFFVGQVKYLLREWTSNCGDGCCFDYGWEIVYADTGVGVWTGHDCPNDDLKSLTSLVMRRLNHDADRLAKQQAEQKEALKERQRNREQMRAIAARDPNNTMVQQLKAWGMIQ